MSKHEWIFVGLRLYGVYLLAQAVMGSTAVLLTLASIADGRDGLVKGLFVQAVGVLLTAGVGWLLAFQTTKLGGYLGRVDEQPT
ncbi:MAG: hypothetical protein O7H41_04245 [Planctomycetota bacterium]|nr:hypothetical protein [Planctomycetota bacterium]